MSDLERLSAAQTQLQKAINLIRDAKALRAMKAPALYVDIKTYTSSSAETALSEVPDGDRSNLLRAALAAGCEALADAYERQALEIQESLLRPSDYGAGCSSSGTGTGPSPESDYATTGTCSVTGTCLGVGS